MPQGITLSEDEIGSVSGSMFDEFFFPHLQYLSNRYGGIGVHCCANARHQWESLRNISGMRLINLYQEQRVIEDALVFFADHAAQWHGYLIDGQSHPLPLKQPDQYPQNARVVISAEVDSQDEALELADTLWEACGRS